MARTAFNRGWLPGLIGDVAALHGRYYAEHWDFGAFFEAKVAREFATYFDRYDPDRDLTLSAEEDGAIFGAITIDAGEPDFTRDGAHLRWFITGPAARGTGIGRTLLTESLAFADAKGYPRIYLTTFAGLDAARHLYESAGFTLVSETDAETWGRTVKEQLFERLRPAGPA